MNVRTPARPANRRLLLLGASLAALLAPAAAVAAGLQVQPDNARLPSGQFLTPSAAAGSSFQPLNPMLKNYPNYLAGQAITSVASPDNTTLLVLTSGYNSLDTATGALDTQASSEYIFVYDISQHVPRIKQVLQIPAAYAGIAFSPDGSRFYVGSGAGDSIYTYANNAGTWAQSGTPIPLGHKNVGVGIGATPSTAGLAVTADGSRLLVANVYNDSVSLVNLATGTVSGELDLRPGVENPADNGVPGGETPFWIAIHGNTAYVTSERDREIDVLDISGTVPAVTARVPVKGNPIEDLLNRAGTRLYVAADNDDSVQVINTANNTVLERINVAEPLNLGNATPRYRGAAPNALALSADENTLFVSLGGENAVATVNVGIHPLHVTTGLLPTGWYPNAVTVSNGWLYAVNGKSDPGPNPGHCNSNSARVSGNPSYLATCQQNQYILNLEAAGLLAEPIPTLQASVPLTLQVGINNGTLQVPNLNDAFVMSQLHQRIKHILYIVKENRTYDQILGDLGKGNGDPTITEFGQAITPNFHALASNFVDLDNFECSGEVSGNGWPWSLQGREPDFNVKTMPMNYSQRTTDAPYDAEDQVRNVSTGIVGLAARQAAIPGYPNDPNLLPGQASDDISDGPDDDGADNQTQHGHIWDAVIKAGLSIKNYGMEVTNIGKVTDSTPFINNDVEGYSKAPAIASTTDPYFRSYDNNYPDYWRYLEWSRDYSNDLANNAVPTFEMMRLNHDHMGNFATAQAGLGTPETQQADDDYAVGRIVQDVANGKDADNTLIFVIEDDAQDGPDHVDAHRSTAYVVGAYVKQGAVVSQRYSTVNMLRTIEDILGTQHLNINDNFQRPMTDIFNLNQAPTWSFTATPSAYLATTTLLPAKQASLLTPLYPTHDAAWWASRTKGWDFSDADRVPAVPFNQLVWTGLGKQGAYPTTRSGVDLSKVHPASAHPGEAKIVR